MVLLKSEPKHEANSYISRFFKENKLGTLLNKANNDELFDNLPQLLQKTFLGDG